MKDSPCRFEIDFTGYGSVSISNAEAQDFVPGADKKAAYGVAGLIIGAVAAKAGFFKLLWVGILAFKKLIVAGVAAVGVWMRRVFGKKKTQETPAAPPTAT